VAAWVLVLGAGPHTITATYSGDSNYVGTSSSSLTPPVSLVQQITKAMSVTTLSAACAAVLPSSQCFVTGSVADGQPPTGGPYHFMMMDAAGQHDGDPSGTVQFFTGATSVGTATLSPSAALNVTSTASLGTNGGVTSAVYSGDGNFQGGNSTPIAKMFTSVSLTSNPNPSTAGQSVTLTATVSVSTVVVDPPTVALTGTVDFLDGATLLGRVQVVGGTAALAVAFSTAGTHSLTATYNGDANYPASTSAVYIQTVNPKGGTGVGVLTLSAGSPSAVYGQQVVFTVGETGSGSASPPQGTVTLMDGATVIGGSNWDLGSAEIVVTLPVGTHQISATWSGDMNWPAATSPVLTYVVTRAATVTTLTSTLAITVTAAPPGVGTPTGTVKVIDSGSGAVLATVTLSGGHGQVTTIYDPLADPGGDGVLEAVYSGDSNFAPSTSAPNNLPVIVTVSGAATSVLAPDEIASIYSANLANSTATGIPPLTTALAGAAVTVTDIAGTSRQSLLYYASPGQINFVVPTGTALGAATLSVAGYNLAISVTSVSPNLFNAAQIVAVHPDGSQTIADTAAPVVFGSDSLYLVLYATGIRNRSSLAAVKCNLGGVILPVTYAGAQSQFPGLDQVVVPLPASLQGSGTLKVMVVADGYNSNSVLITFQ
jgi:uncharacterized protein (TIGR03437 family)